MKNIALIQKILEVKKKSFSKNSLLEDYNWDSLSMLNLISLLSKYKKINAQDLTKLKTLKELDTYITKIKK